MASAHVLSFLFLLTQNLLLNCASAAVHTHNVDSQEREDDGAYRARDASHYGDAGHNSEFDHEAILGSVKEAEEYEKLSPEEAKWRLGQLLPQMDKNGDGRIDQDELKQWILKSFQDIKEFVQKNPISDNELEEEFEKLLEGLYDYYPPEKLSREEAQERMNEVDNNQDGLVTWAEYMQDAFGVDAEEDIGPEDTGDTGLLVHEEKRMFSAADMNGDGQLDINEFEVFSTPEEHEEMHGYLVNQTLREKDRNQDGRIDFEEFLTDRVPKHDPSWKLAERDRFDNDLDLDGDGRLDAAEIRAWVVPDNDEIATEEVEHLFASADDDGDGYLSFEEILDHHQQFVGSEATDFGGDLMGAHFDDEL